MIKTPNKCPIRFIEKHTIHYDRKNNLEKIATQFSNIDKWISNEDIDTKLSNNY